MIDATLWLERAEALLANRELSEASLALNNAEMLGAEPNRCSSNRWMAAMLVGDFSAAWEQSDRIRNYGEPDPHRFWHGEDLTGKRVIVRCLHGLGDTVQMLCYAPLLAQAAASVVYEVSPPMVEVATQFKGVHHVFTWGNDAPIEAVPWDVQVEVMELPYIFRTHLEHLPLEERYLSIPAAVAEKAAIAMGESRQSRVGIVWSGGEWNLDRAISLAELRPLLNIPHIEFWNLQGGSAREQASTTEMRDATQICGDGLLALSATIQNLDLVITVDTLAAHLAGAMGKPVWVMLQYAADWRWMHGREDSYWYPTMRLFRQPRPGDWTGVVAQVCAALAVSERELRTT